MGVAIQYTSESELIFISRQITIIHNINFRCPIVLKFGQLTEVILPYSVLNFKSILELSNKLLIHGVSRDLYLTDIVHYNSPQDLRFLYPF